MWDPIQPQDHRGDEILDWILDNDLYILNDGSATRTSRFTGNDSTPDISHCRSNWLAKTSWKLAEPIGNSDHVSIIIELNHKICYKPASQDLLDGVGMVLIGPVLLTKSNQK